jgi:quercetin dioxygenase-like cupin family protein
VLGTEELAPGAAIQKHRHLVKDEILLIQSGTAHVWLGDQERDVHAGGLAFIPSVTNERRSNSFILRPLPDVLENESVAG